MKSSFQKQNRPTKRIENKCNGTVVDGVCTSCGRYLTKSIAHRPNEIGSLGYVEYYSNGTTYNTFGGK